MLATFIFLLRPTMYECECKSCRLHHSIFICASNSCAPQKQATNDSHHSISFIQRLTFSNINFIMLTKVTTTLVCVGEIFSLSSFSGRLRLCSAITVDSHISLVKRCACISSLILILARLFFTNLSMTIWRLIRRTDLTHSSY